MSDPEASRYYHRDGRPAASYRDIAHEWDGDNKRVASTTIGVAEVSTVYLGINHQWGDGPPLIFESMVFGGPHDQTTRRYSTELEARAGHEELVAAVSAEIPADVVALQALLTEHEFGNTWQQAQALFDAGVRAPQTKEVTDE